MRRGGITVLSCICALLLGANVAAASVTADLLPQTEKWYCSQIADKLTTQYMHTVVGASIAGATIIHRDIIQSGVIVRTENLLMSGTVEGDLYYHGTLETGRFSEPILWVSAPLSVGKTWTDSRPAVEGDTNPDNRVHYVFACLEEQTITCPAGVYPAQRVFVAAVFPDGHTELSNYWYNEHCGLVMLTLENQRLFVLNKAVPGDSHRDYPVLVPDLDKVGVQPNPANPQTDVRFELGRPGAVDVSIYDVAGRLVRRLARGLALGPGPHSLTWDGRNQAGRTAASGVYVFEVCAGGEAQRGRLTLVR